VKEPNMFHNYETEKITRKASDAAENPNDVLGRNNWTTRYNYYNVLFGFRPRESLVKTVTWQKTCNYNVVRLVCLRSSCTTHISADLQRITFGELAVVD